jgi:hypothetical protein
MPLSEKWKQTVNDGLTNKLWDEYDQLIKSEVASYNTRFEDTPGFGELDWLIVKAMLWSESGGPKSAAWTSRPMQIGNKGDPGYSTLKSSKEGADLIMSEELKIDIRTKNINDPHLNIRAGVAYLFVRMVKTDMESVLDLSDKEEHEHTVETGDSLSSIANKVGSTVEILQQMNPEATVLKLNQKIKYRKAQIQRVIKGWREFSYGNISQRYNVGDPDYAEKLKYVMSLFEKLKR